MLKRFLTFLGLWVLLTTGITFHFFTAANAEDNAGKVIGYSQLLHSKEECSTETHSCENSFYYKNPLAEETTIEYNHFGNSDEEYAKRFDTLDLTLHPGSSFTREDKPTPRSLNHCKSLVYRSLINLPEKQASALKNLTLYFSDEGRRGLGGGSTIILRCQNVTDKEAVAVFVHEMGHVVDTGLIQGTPDAGASEFKDGNHPVYQDDLSLLFYRLSFKDEKTVKENALPLDFVSGYALSDPFEDFAESYNFYVLHGNEFREMAKTSDILQKKYNFLRVIVFHGQEFSNGDNHDFDIFYRHYDTTVLDYDMNNFFAFHEQETPNEQE